VTNPNQAISDSREEVGSRSRQWNLAMIEAGARSRGTTPRARLLAVFDVLDDLINRADRDARAFVTLLARASSGTDLDRDETALNTGLQTLVSTLVAETDSKDDDELRQSWSVLIKGSIQRAIDGDLGAARRAGEMAGDVIARLGSPRIVPVPAAVGSGFSFDFEGPFESGQPAMIGSSAFSAADDL
jgi:hypothetical protein